MLDNLTPGIIAVDAPGVKNYPASAMSSLNAACPDCTWAIHAVIGRVDFVPLAPRRWWQRGDTERAGPLCKCARCGSEFYCAQGQVHRFLEGAQQPTFAPGVPAQNANGDRRRGEFERIVAGMASLDDLQPPP